MSLIGTTALDLDQALSTRSAWREENPDDYDLVDDEQRAAADAIHQREREAIRRHLAGED